MAGTVSATSQTMTSTTADPGQTCRTPNVAPNNSAHPIATARTGVSVLRPSLVAPCTRSASRAMIATNSPIATSTRAGPTSSSMTRGSCATAMNALGGQSELQLTHGAGVAYASTSSAV